MNESLFKIGFFLIVFGLFILLVKLMNSISENQVRND